MPSRMKDGLANAFASLLMIPIGAVMVIAVWPDLVAYVRDDVPRWKKILVAFISVMTFSGLMYVLVHWSQLRWLVRVIIYSAVAASVIALGGIWSVIHKTVIRVREADDDFLGPAFMMLLCLLMALAVLMVAAGFISVVALVALIEVLPHILFKLRTEVPQDLQPTILTSCAVSLSVAVYVFRARHRFWYGVLESLFAIASTWVAAEKIVARPGLDAGLSIIATCYLCVRGLDNAQQGAKQSSLLGRGRDWLVSTKQSRSSP